MVVDFAQQVKTKQTHNHRLPSHRCQQLRRHTTTLITVGYGIDSRDDGDRETDQVGDKVSDEITGQRWKRIPK